VARNRATWPGFFVNMGIGGTYLSFAGLWAVPFLTEGHGLSRAVATWHTTLMLVCFALSSLATGRLSDRLGRRRPLMLGLGLAYLLCWLPWLAGARPPLWASLGLFAVMGATATGFTLSWASVKEVNPPALSGTAMAVVNTGVFLGPAICQPLVGWMLDRAIAARTGVAAIHAPDDFRRGLAVLAAFALLGLLAALRVRETHGRNTSADAPPGPAR
jgi:MFS family permease